MEKYANNKLLSACKSTRNYEITELNWTALTSCFIFGNVFAFFLFVSGHIVSKILRAKQHTSYKCFLTIGNCELANSEHEQIAHKKPSDGRFQTIN